MTYTEANTLENLINICVGAHEEQCVDSSMMRRRLAESIDRCVTQLFDKVMKYFRKTKFERYYPKEIVTNLGGSISAISDELIGIVLGLNVELDKLSEEVYKSRKDKSHYGWEPRGAFWTQ